MFNRAVFLKTLRDSAPSIVLALIGMIAFQIVFVWAMLNMGSDLLEFVSKVPFIKKIFEMSLGISVEGDISVNILFGVCFTHAVILSLVWTVIISTVTRTTVGEIERGTADMLLTLPVTRSEVFISSSFVWVLAALFLSFCPLLGFWIALQFFETQEPVDISRYVAPATNFLALNLCVGGLSAMVSCVVDRRSVAVGTIVSLALVSVVLNFVEPFIESIRSIRFLGLLNYFRPVDIIRTGIWPVTSICILLAVAALCWSIGLIVFSRRDIATA